ncbi:hypothetical protein FB451DRAFT_1178955 [Mycena latifolia]|nr:hypothetical protein FB451DRAFT_1178955 [Mycena latifolia]
MNLSTLASVLVICLFSRTLFPADYRSRSLAPTRPPSARLALPHAQHNLFILGSVLWADWWLYTLEKAGWLYPILIIPQMGTGDRHQTASLMHVQYSGSETEGWSAQKFEYTAGTFLGTLGVVIKGGNDILRFLKTLVVHSSEPPSLVSLNVNACNEAERTLAAVASSPIAANKSPMRRSADTVANICLATIPIARNVTTLLNASSSLGVTICNASKHPQIPSTFLNSRDIDKQFVNFCVAIGMSPSRRLRQTEREDDGSGALEALGPKLFFFTIPMFGHVFSTEIRPATKVKLNCLKFVCGPRTR